MRSESGLRRESDLSKKGVLRLHHLRRVLRIVSSAVVGAVVGVLAFSLAFSGTNSAAGAHTVQPGDTFYLIAQRYGLAADQLMSANGYYGYDLLYPGQVLTIPAGEGGTAEAGAAGSQQYTVRPGDTLDLIARQYGVSVDSIISGNNLRDDLIYPGQLLLLPGGISSPVSSSGASRANLTNADAYLLAQLINAEAAGESFEGQVAVGAVVLNRLLHPNFPKTVRDVVFQYEGGAYQFEPVINGSIYEQPGSSAIQAANAALTGWDPTNGALFFYNPRKSGSSFFDSWLTFLRQIGNHLFYTY